MAHSHGCVSRAEKRGNRLADNERAPDHGDLGAIEGNAIEIKQLENRLGGAGSKAAGHSGKHPEQGCARQAVDVLGRIERLANGSLVDKGRQRPEHQYAVNVPTRVQLINLGDECLGIDLGLFKMKDLGIDAQRIAALQRTALVGKVVLAATHTHDCEFGGNAGLPEGGDATKKFFINRLSHGQAQEQLGQN